MPFPTSLGGMGTHRILLTEVICRVNQLSSSQSCHISLGLPTCALWLPDPDAIIKLFTHEIPAFLGGWGLVAIVTASMSSK